MRLASILAQVAALVAAVVPAAPAIAFASTAAGAAPPMPAQVRPPALGLEIRGAIGPATAEYVEQGLDTAQRRGSPFVILEIDTPGGLSTSMREIISAILSSSVPVVAYVAPPGARAASAGTYILYACHFAAMAPATNLGAATPVSIGGSEPAPPAENPTKARESKKSGKAEKAGATGKARKSGEPAKAGKPGEPGTAGKTDDTEGAGEETPAPAQAEPMSAEERKVLNDSVAYIRGLAQLRGRNADWAEEAVRGAASLPATQALQQHVIDLIAPDLPSLLTQLNGRETRIGDRAVRLDTRGIEVSWLKPDWRTRLLGIITNPEIAYGLLLIGLWGLLFEGYHPGGVLPGVVGVICLLVALFAFQLLPTNFAGLALLIVGAGMIAAEFFFPTYGSLGIGGLIAFIVGSLILFSRTSGLQVALPLIGGLATVGGLVILGIVYLATHAARSPVVTGTQAMLGAVVEAVEDFAARGRVRYGGELWNACSAVPLKAGQAARVVKIEGLTLWVEPLP
ncbi:MAG TPA: nodulation protein NfeD [Steroidobacteraceae bacterium]|nr:nodulation protein NfeD [Steroidobacteraceae bacterium]